MPSYFGELIQSGTHESLSAVVTLERGTIRVVAAQTDLGTWKLSQVPIREGEDGTVVVVPEGEELVFVFKERDSFLAETASYRRGQDRLRRSEEHPAFRNETTTLSEDIRSSGEELRQDVTREVSGVVDEVRDLFDLVKPGPPLFIILAVFLVLVVFTPGLVVGLALLGGVLALVGGAITYADESFAAKLPGWTTPARLIAVGVVLLGVGLLVSIVS